MSDGPLPNAPQLGHGSVYYAIIDQDGRILSMNAAMNTEFGPGTLKQLDHFQSLLSEADREVFTTLLTNNDPNLQTLSLNLYTYAGPHRTQLFTWSFFHLISGKDANGYILCAGHMSDKALLAESVMPIQKNATAPTDQQDALFGMLIKMLEHERLVIGQELHDNVN